MYFLNMEIIQPLPGACEVKIYDKRDNMPTLAAYRKFPHIETTISVRCKYAVLHSQSCRFSYRFLNDRFPTTYIRIFRNNTVHGS